jgi:hypothetical protein
MRFVYIHAWFALWIIMAPACRWPSGLALFRSIPSVRSPDARRLAGSDLSVHLVMIAQNRPGAGRRARGADYAVNVQAEAEIAKLLHLVETLVTPRGVGRGARACSAALVQSPAWDPEIRQSTPTVAPSFPRESPARAQSGSRAAGRLTSCDSPIWPRGQLHQTGAPFLKRPRRLPPTRSRSSAIPARCSSPLEVCFAFQSATAARRLSSVPVRLHLRVGVFDLRA